MPTIDNWRALRDALDQMFEVCAHLDVWKYREGETNEWGAQCYEIDCETYGIEEIATAYDPETAAYIAAAHPAAIRSLLDERDRLAAEVEALRADARRYRWLRDVSVPPHNFYVAVPVEFEGVKYTPAEVDAGIDAAMKGKP